MKRFLSHFATAEPVSASTQNQALAAILFLYREVLSIQLPWLEDVTRARKPPRLPVVLVKALLAQLDGVHRLLASLMYGSGLCLMEALRLRVKDADLEHKIVTAPEGKGGEDHRTLLPDTLVEPIGRQLQKVALIHAQDREINLPPVQLPQALERKYLNAGRELAWQFLFPAP